MDHDDNAGLTAEEMAELANDEAAFESSFTSDGSDPRRSEVTPDPLDKPAPVTGAPAAPSPPAAPAVDPFAGMPDAAKAMLAKLPEIERELNRWKGQSAAQMREIDALKKQQRRDEPTAPHNAAPSPANEPAELPELALVRTQGLPEVADAITAAFKAARGDNPAAPAPAAPAPAPAATEDEEVDILNRRRPSWGADMGSADFKLWCTTQGDDFHQKVYSTEKALVVVDALDRWDAHKRAVGDAATAAAREASRRTNRAADAVQPRGGAAPVEAGDPTEEDVFLASFNS